MKDVEKLAEEVGILKDVDLIITAEFSKDGNFLRGYLARTRINSSDIGKPYNGSTAREIAKKHIILIEPFLIALGEGRRIIGLSRGEHPEKSCGNSCKHDSYTQVPEESFGYEIRNILNKINIPFKGRDYRVAKQKAK